MTLLHFPDSFGSEHARECPPILRGDADGGEGEGKLLFTAAGASSANG